MRLIGPGQLSFAMGVMGLGALGLIYRDFAMQWQPVPPWVPGREGLALMSGALMMACGIGLLFNRSTRLATRVLLGYLVAWLVLLKLPKVIAAPLVEGTWLGAGEIAVLVAAGWILFATPEQSKGVRLARWLFGIALLPVGLSHFVYPNETIALVPTWLPAHRFWAYFGGAGHVAAGLGVLFAVLPRLAATMEAGMIGAFTLLVWVPGVLAAPSSRLQWTALVVSWTIAAAAWVVADSYRGTPWLTTGQRPGV